MYVPDAVKLAKFAKLHSLEPFTAGIATLIVHHLLIVVHLYEGSVSRHIMHMSKRPSQKD